MKTSSKKNLLYYCAFLMLTIVNCLISIYSTFIFKKNLSNEFNILKENVEIKTQILKINIDKIESIFSKYENISQTYINILEKSENQALINILPKESGDSIMYYFITFTGLFAFYLLSAAQTNLVLKHTIMTIINTYYRNSPNNIYPIDTSMLDQKMPSLQQLAGDLNDINNFHDLYIDIVKLALESTVCNLSLTAVIDIIYKYFFT